ncbi:MAG: autotransporter domain-containing protein, partial [Elusimicrobiota bacterium]|nr:autotransporter domain-containing protein [Elusimicrobiota bacterium]
DGANAYNFTFSNASNIKITDLEFKNFYNPSNAAGGAFTINNDSKVIFTGQLSFVGNTAAGLGGAIYVLGDSEVIFRNAVATFDGNKQLANLSGGAISVGSNSFFTADHSTLSFTNHIAGSAVTYGSGGAIGATGGNASYVFTGGGLYISHNVATGPAGSTAAGGAIAFHNRAGSRFLADGTIVYIASNSAWGSARGGGFMYNREGELSLKNSVSSMIYNYTIGSGGSILMTGPSTVTFENESVYMIGNTAAINGGIIADTNYIANGTRTVSFINSKVRFEGNTAQLGGLFYLQNAFAMIVFDGGDIELIDNLSASTISLGTISLNNGAKMSLNNINTLIGRGNRAAGGGFLYLPKTSFTFEGNILELANNTAFGNAASGYGRGGAFYFDGSTAVFSGAKMSFIGNTASSGAVLYATNRSSIIFTGNNSEVLFEGNVSTVGKGVLMWDNYSEVGFIGLSALKVINNTAIGGGGFLYIAGSNYELGSDDILINGNFTPSSGGAVYLDNSKLDFKSLRIDFSSNTSYKIGGAMYLSGSTVSFNISEMIFQYNTAPSGAVLFANNKSSVTFSNGSILFSHNVSSNGRGVIAWEKSSSVSFTNLTSLEALGNAASSGGFLYISSAEFNIGSDRINLSGNSAMRGVGGAIYLAGSTMQFNNVEMNYNASYSSGGAIYLQASSLTFRDTKEISFIGNVSTNGAGGVFFIDSLSVLIFKNIGHLRGINNAALEGGFAYLINQKYTFDRNLMITMEGNTAISGNGGVFYLDASTMTFDGENPRLIRNTAYNSGGAIYAGNGSYLEFKNFEMIEFYKQTALTGRGGAVYVDPTSTFSFRNVGWINAQNNYAGEGGVFYFERQKYDFGSHNTEVRMTLTANTAGMGGGGAIYLNNSELNFADGNRGGGIMRSYSEMDYNAAFSSGGIILLTNFSTVTFSNFETLKFTSNTALNGGGGAFYADEHSSLSFSNVKVLTFDKNTAGFGGALGLTGSIINFSGDKIVFASNSASGAGGAFYADASIVNFRVQAIEFFGNKAGGNGTLSLLNRSSLKGGLEGVRDILAINNTASSGGVLYLENMIFDYDGNFEAIGNEATGDGFNKDGRGGVIYAANSTVTISGANAKKDILFKDNAVHPVYGSGSKTGGAGGAIYIENSSFTLRTDGYNIIFDNNMDVGLKPNDIAVYGKSELILHAYDDRRIELNSGLEGSADTMINKTGYGNLILGGMIDYEGSLNIWSGDVSISRLSYTPGSIPVVHISSLYIHWDGAYRTLWKTQIHRTVMEKAAIKGTIETGIDFYDADTHKIAADTFEAFEGSGEFYIDSSTSTFLAIKIQRFIPIAETQTIKIIRASTITGMFANYADQQESWNPFKVQYTVDKGKDADGDYIQLGITSKYDFAGVFQDLNHNEAEVVNLIDGIREVGDMFGLLSPLSDLVLSEQNAGNMDYSKTRALFNELSGGFLANVISAGAIENNDWLYSKIRLEEIERERVSILQYLWTQFNYSGFSLADNSSPRGDLEWNTVGAQAGFPIWRGKNSLGIYLNYQRKNIEQKQNKAWIDDIKAGVYAGYLIGEKDINIKAHISGGVQNINTERKLDFFDFTQMTKSNFNAYSINAGAQGEYIIPVDKETDFKPFIEMQGGLIINGDLEESGAKAVNLIVKSGTYFRLISNIGLMLEDSTGSFNWHFKGYTGFFLAGSRPEFETAFVNLPNNKMNTWGTENANIYAGASAWIQYQISDDFSAYINADVKGAKRMLEYAASLGLNYRIGGSYDKLEISEEAARERKAAEAREAAARKRGTGFVAGAETGETQEEAANRKAREVYEGALYDLDVRIEMEEKLYANKINSGDNISKVELAEHRKLIEDLKSQRETMRLKENEVSPYRRQTLPLNINQSPADNAASRNGKTADYDDWDIFEDDDYSADDETEIDGAGKSAKSGMQSAAKDGASVAPKSVRTASSQSVAARGTVIIRGYPGD